MQQVNLSPSADFLNMALLSLHKGKLVEDQTVLSDLGVQGGQTVQVEIQSADPVNKPLKYTKVSPTYKLPDKVNVKVEIGKYIYVTIGSFCTQ